MRLYSELVIHGCIYQLRPDVNSVCHHHAISVLPFCISGVEMVPVMHLGATMGAKVPFWDSQDEFGDTPLLVTTPEQGMSMAKALGEYWTVLLRRHGATVAGRSIRENVFRSIYGCRNAELQARALAMGHLGPLTKGEVEQCGGHSLTARTLVPRLGILGAAAGEGRKRHGAAGRCRPRAGTPPGRSAEAGKGHTRAAGAAKKSRGRRK